MSRPQSQAGFTLVELLAAMAIAAVLFASLGSIVFTSIEAESDSRERRELTRQARFAMDRMLDALRRGGPLVLPLADDPATPQDESVRDLLSVALDPTRDLDSDGTPDADNDGDGRINEDWWNDANADWAHGISGLDDDADGSTDEPNGDFTNLKDDDEDGAWNEDPLNGIDDDGDGSVDEDPSGDLNGDGAPGIAGVDDDGDGNVDEGDPFDDDEDGQSNEDWLDTVSFYRSGGILLERSPVTWDTDGDGSVDGRDFVESPLAEGVTDLVVTRLGKSANGRTLVEVRLELTGAGGQVVNLADRVRVGAQP
jgi:prepilin-type N-terminal cleavage/methylation domain-containing protein